MMIYPGMFRVASANMTQFATSLSLLLHRIVVDKTGLSGNFAFDVQFAREPGIGLLLALANYHLGAFTSGKGRQ